MNLPATRRQSGDSRSVLDRPRAGAPLPATRRQSVDSRSVLDRPRAGAPVPATRRQGVDSRSSAAGASHLRFLPPSLLTAILAFPAAALAGPSQEDILRSISQNVSEGGDSSHAMAIFCLLAAILLLMVAVAHRRAAKSVEKPLNHQGKLLRETARALGIKSAEVKRLKRAADQVSARRDAPLKSPLTLLLCPSLAKPKTPSPK